MRSDLGFLKSILNDVIEKIYPELKEYKIDLRIKYGILYPATVVLIDKEDKRVVIHIDGDRISKLGYIDWFLIFCHELAHIILGVSWKGTENMSLLSNKVLSDLIEAVTDLIALVRLLFYAHHQGDLPEEVLWRSLEELTLRLDWIESLVSEEKSSIIEAINAITNGKFRKIAEEYLKRYLSIPFDAENALTMILKNPFKLLSFYLILSKTLGKDYDEEKEMLCQKNSIF